MTDFYFRWGNDVQPYVLQLASEHIETLSEYCCNKIERVLAARAERKIVVVPLLPRVDASMMRGEAVHRFRMFGFKFELRETQRHLLKSKKPEFVLNFGVAPDFQPEDMPPRLRRIGGKPLSARPRKNRRPRSAAPARAKAPPRKRGKGRRYNRVSYCMSQLSRLAPAAFAALPSTLAAKLYKMYETYQGLSAQAVAMWRRRPRLHSPTVLEDFLTRLTERPAYTPARAQLEPRLIGESVRLRLFSFVSREPAIDWSAYPFGRVSEEGERIPA